MQKRRKQQWTANTFSLCEPGAIGALLDLSRDWSDGEAAEALGTLTRVLGRSQNTSKCNFAIKLTDIVSLDICRMRSLLPWVPSLFIYRNPLEIMVSLERAPTGTLAEFKDKPDMIATRTRLPALNDPGMQGDEAAARILGAVFQAAAAAARSAKPLAPLRIIDYRSLPGSFCEIIAPLFGLGTDDQERGRMEHVALRYSKGEADRSFQADREDKLQAVTPRIARLVENFVAPYSEQCRRLIH